MLAKLDTCSDFHPSALAHIYQDDVNLSIWRRQLSPHIAAYAQALIEQPHCFKTRFILPPENISERLQKELPLHKDRQVFIDDITLVADMFTCLFELDHVGLRMEVLNTAMCPSFHVDKVPSRLITTYVGACTQWLPNNNVKRDSKGKVKAQANTAFNRFNVGDVAILKGESWIGNEGKGLVHRSPSANNTSRRLVLTLDFA